jgi:beta-N-acetylhexosaminidase
VTLAAVFGLAGTELTRDERGFFRDADPAGYILFARNCFDPKQLRALTDDLRALHGREDLLVMTDQEGGRVARLKPPHWPAFPPAAAFARLYEKAPMSAIEAARANAEAMAILLREAGISMNCAPVLDLRHPVAHDVVGDRAFGSEAMQVAALGRATLDGFAAGGVAGCVKHIPGHGRARTDSHKELPSVEAGRDELEQDFAPFRSLAARAPAAMVAHIVYLALDPQWPASVSAAVIGETIRDDIAFDGLLLSDDICMAALSGRQGERAAAVVGAGCDLALHCSGVLREMKEVAAAVGEMSEAARERVGRAKISPRLDAASAERWQQLAKKRDALMQTC